MRDLDDCHQTMTVKSCSSCPFYWFDGMGNCNAVDRTFSNITTIPEWCPLKNDVVVVKLKETP